MRSKSLGERIRALFASAKGPIFDQLEDLLIEADLGAAAAAEIVEAARSEIRSADAGGKDRLIALMRQRLGQALRAGKLELVSGSVNLYLVLGVNGVGKTTTIAKLAHHFLHQQGKRVLLAAADTFRAAAIDQIELWGRRLGVPVVRQEPGADPGAVVFDAISSAQANEVDLVIADTAGRMHNKAHLVRELGKIHGIAGRRIPEGAYRRILVIDATTGQNALRQAEVFQEAVGIDSIIVAKYDSTAKGGLVVTIGRELGIPVSFMGVGEKPQDLEPFDAELYLKRLLELP